MKKVFYTLSILVIMVFSLSSLISCTHFLLFGNYELTPISIYFFNFFNQKQFNNTLKFNWSGDWVFRRKRLALIDKEILIQKPDILIMKELMQKEGSPSESDINILKAGSLQFYNIDTAFVINYKETYEQESVGIAVKYPIDIIRQEKNNIWFVNDKNFIAAFVVKINQELALIIYANLQEVSSNYFNFISEKIHIYLNEFNICKYRVIVAGEFNIEAQNPLFLDFLRQQKLQDTDKSFCNPYFKCATITEENDIFKKINFKFNTIKPDKILVHKNTKVILSQLVFNKSIRIEDQDSIIGKYEITNLYPSFKYGWSTKIFLPKCIAKN